MTAAGGWICNPENRSAGMSFPIITDNKVHVEVTEDGFYSPSTYVRLSVLVGFPAGEILANMLSKSICSILSGS